MTGDRDDAVDVKGTDASIHVRPIKGLVGTESGRLNGLALPLGNTTIPFPTDISQNGITTTSVTIGSSRLVGGHCLSAVRGTVSGRCCIGTGTTH